MRKFIVLPFYERSVRKGEEGLHGNGLGMAHVYYARNKADAARKHAIRGGSGLPTSEHTVFVIDSRTATKFTTVFHQPEVTNREETYG